MWVDLAFQVISDLLVEDVRMRKNQGSFPSVSFCLQNQSILRSASETFFAPRASNFVSTSFLSMSRTFVSTSFMNFGILLGILSGIRF